MIGVPSSSPNTSGALMVWFVLGGAACLGSILEGLLWALQVPEVIGCRESAELISRAVSETTERIPLFIAILMIFAGKMSGCFRGLADFSLSFGCG